MTQVLQGKILTDRGMTVILNGTPYSVDNTHQNYNLLLENYKEGDWDAFLTNYERYGPIKNYVTKDSLGNSTNLTYENGKVFYREREIHGVLVNRILEMQESALSVDDMVLFLDNLMSNPSNRSRDELYEFLAHENLPLTDDGCFLAYKAVDKDYYSKARGNLELVHGTANDHGYIFNGVGEVIECHRNDVDDNRDNHCSHGLHVGSLEYSGPEGWYHSRGDCVVIVKVNPKDVVSVPPDHSSQKIRVCRYEVISEFTVPLHSCHMNAVESTKCCQEKARGDVFERLMDDYYIRPMDMQVGELYVFDYEDEEGRRASLMEHETRTATVLMRLEPDDINYKGDETNLRRFIVTKMRDVESY